MQDALNFAVGTQHENLNGSYTVTGKMDKGRFTVRYEDGTEATLTMMDQVRIARKMAEECTEDMGISIDGPKMPDYGYTLGMLARYGTLRVALKKGDGEEKFAGLYYDATGGKHGGLNPLLGEPGSFTYVNATPNLWGSAYMVDAPFEAIKQHPRYYNLSFHTGLEVREDQTCGNKWWMGLVRMGFRLGQQDPELILATMEKSKHPYVRSLANHFLDGYTDNSLQEAMVA